MGNDASSTEQKRLRSEQFRARRQLRRAFVEIPFSACLVRTNRLRFNGPVTKIHGLRDIGACDDLCLFFNGFLNVMEPGMCKNGISNPTLWKTKMKE